MIRLIFLGVLIYILYALIRKVLLPPSGRAGKIKRYTDPGGVVDEMVQCSQCGVYVPKREAVTRTVDGKRLHFCNESCGELYRQEQERA